MNHNKLINIDMVVSESEINVINAMFDYYNKAYLFIENYHGDVEDCCDILQEQLIMESATKNETKNKKSILKQLLDLVKKLCRKAINGIKKHIIDPIRSASNIKKNKSNNSNNVPETQIEEPVKIDDIITFTNRLLNIDIFRKDINVNELEHDLCTILEDKGGMTPVEKLCDKMEKVTNIIKRIETKINDIDKRVDEVDNFVDEGGEYVSQLYSLCCILRKLLSKYIELAKDVDYKIKESMGSDNNVIDDKYRIGVHCIRYKKGEDEPMNPELEDKIFKLAITCRSTNNYDEYRSAYVELCDILGFHKDSVIMSGSSSKSSLKGGYFLWRVNDSRETATITLKPGTKLYHTSLHKGLTELKPSFRATGSIRNDDKVELETNCDTMYPTQRVYFFLKNPGSRFDTNNTRKYKPQKREYVYEYTVDRSMKVKVDTEATHKSYRKSVFIETDTPIPVKDVTDEFKD